MAKGKAKRKTMARYAAGTIAPTPERIQHDTIERKGGQIVDSHGNIGHPFRVVDTLAMMERRGTITKAMHRAGMQFRDDFSTGLLDRLKGMTLVRTDGGGRDGLAVRQLDARARVHSAMDILGGNGSPSGSCAWHVLGEGMSIKEWSMRIGWTGRSIHPDTASGILLAVLGILVPHYGLDQTRLNKG